jgi:hypothetical protein
MWSRYEAQRMEERRRNDSLRSKRHEQEMRRYEAAIAVQEQDRREQQERWELEKREWEIKLVHSIWRERIEIAGFLICLVVATVLLISGIRGGDLSSLGGSGVFGAISFSWALRSEKGRRISARI